MFIYDLFKVQKENDKCISLNPDLDDYKLRARKNLELHVKVSSLAHVTNCYNYTTNNNLEVNTDIIFEKYIDCLKQVLSIGLTNNYDTLTEIDIQPNDYCLSDQFLNLYIDINDLIISRSKDHYETLFEDLLSLGITLGFSEEQILNEFKK